MSGFNPPAAASRPIERLSETEFEIDDERPAARTVNPKPGPGLGEAIVWALGVLIAHVFAGIFMLFAVYLAAPEPSQDMLVVLTNQNRLKRFVDTYMVSITAGEMGLFVVAVISAAWIRLGRRADLRLRLVPVSTGHLALIAVIMLPLSLLCGQLHVWAKTLWQHLEVLVPQLQFLTPNDTMESILPLAESASLPTLVLILGLAPAVSEELVFRGVIGRGLVARWGLAPGILLTSALFGMVHLHPAHAVALLPLAVVIHLSYLATRSFLAPVLIHFLNNAFAAVMLKLPLQSDGTHESGLPVGVVLSAAVCCVCVATAVWQSRREWRLPNGQTWDPGYPSVEAPPSDVQAVEQGRRLSKAAVILVALGVLQFAAILSLHSASVAQSAAP